MGERIVKCGRCGGPMVATGEIGSPDGDWQCQKCDASPSCPLCTTKDVRIRELEEEVRRWKEVNPNAINIRYIIQLEKDNKNYTSRFAALEKVVEAADRRRKRKGHGQDYDCDLCNLLRTIMK